MSSAREKSDLFTRPLRPASYLCNSQNKGQESIKQTHAWLGTRAQAFQNITQSVMSREERMDGITDGGRIVSFSIGKRTENHLQCPTLGGHAASLRRGKATNLLLKWKP